MNHNEHCSCGHEHSHTHHHEEHCSCGHEHSHTHHEEHTPTYNAPKDLSGKRLVFILENLGCAHCAAKMEEKINKLPEIQFASITFTTKQLAIISDYPEQNLQEKLQDICSSIESEVKVLKKERRTLPKENPKKELDDIWELPSILLGCALFLGGIVTKTLGFEEISFGIFLISYLILGSKVLLAAAKNTKIIKGDD